MANRTAVPVAQERPRPSPVERVRALPRRTVLVAALTTVAVVTGVVIVVASNRPDGPPGHYAALTGVGSDNASAVLGALAVADPDLGPVDARQRGHVTTKDPDVNPACTLDRPTGDAAAVTALAASEAAARASQSIPCVDFAWSAVDRSADPAFAAAGLTWIPFARDAVTFVERADSPNPKALTSAQLRSVFTCGDVRFLPLLPDFGSGVRAAFLAGIGLPDSADLASAHPCLQPAGTGDQTGIEMTDPRQIAPVSVGDYLGQTAGAEPDLHGSAVLGRIDGRSTTVADPAATVGIAMRPDSLGARTPTVAQLKALYGCTAGESTLRHYHPLLPGPGSRVRAQFLAVIGLLDGPDFAARHSCVRQTDGTGRPLPENTGTVLTDATALVPYAGVAYEAQVDGTAPDLHGDATFASLDGRPPRVLDPASPLAHDVYVVVPTAKLATAPTSAAFVGTGSVICTHPEILTGHGFATASDCGSTALHTPR